MANRILIIDDDSWALRVSSALLEKHGYTVTTAANAERALAELDVAVPDLIMLDVFMPGTNGFELCDKIKSRPQLADVPIIFVTATDDSQVVSRCFSAGGADYIGKPVRDYELLARLKLHLGLRKRDRELREIESENVALKNFVLQGKLERPEAFAAIITADSVMRSIFKYIEAIAQSSRSVLITGETGVGKEIFANVIHGLSGRPGQFITVNVAGLDDNLFSDTLFGHEKGAYTGADRARKGLIEQAGTGTLFLDEIGDLKAGSQVKLLRLLQEQEYYPLGSDQRKISDARLIVATNRDLPQLIKGGQFREDLYYRLRTHQIHIPPLRERKGDIGLLLDHFVKTSAQELGRPTPRIPSDVLQLLSRYDFPGNIRELEAIVFDAVSQTQTQWLSVESIRAAIGQSRNLAPLDDSPSGSSSSPLVIASEGPFPTLKEADAFLIREALRRSDGNQSRAARLLGLSRQALNKRLTRSVP